MSKFLKEIVKGSKFELLIDTKIFSKDIILKAAYNFLDKGYFFFKLDDDGNIILEFTVKQGVELDPKYIIGEYSDELLDVYLRDKLEKENKIIRETIVTKALNGPLDMGNFVSLDTDSQQGEAIDFEKDIDEILKEIENDPDLQIDEQEIENILQEIDADKSSKPQITVSLDSIKSIKNKFKNN